MEADLFLGSKYSHIHAWKLILPSHFAPKHQKNSKVSQVHPSRLLHTLKMSKWLNNHWPSYGESCSRYPQSPDGSLLILLESLQPFLHLKDFTCKQEISKSNGQFRGIWLSTLKPLRGRTIFISSFNAMLRPKCQLLLTFPLSPSEQTLTECCSQKHSWMLGWGLTCRDFWAVQQKQISVWFLFRLPAPPSAAISTVAMHDNNNDNNNNNNNNNRESCSSTLKTAPLT